MKTARRDCAAGVKAARFAASKSGVDAALFSRLEDRLGAALFARDMGGLMRTSTSVSFSIVASGMSLTCAGGRRGGACQTPVINRAYASIRSSVKIAIKQLLTLLLPAPAVGKYTGTNSVDITGWRSHERDDDEIHVHIQILRSPGPRAGHRTGNGQGGLVVLVSFLSPRVQVDRRPHPRAPHAPGAVRDGRIRKGNRQPVPVTGARRRRVRHCIARVLPTLGVMPAHGEAGAARPRAFPAARSRA